MNGPRVGAFSITDKAGLHYMACPSCGASGCPACASSGRIQILPLHPAPSYLPGTYISSASIPGHVNHIAPASPADIARTFAIVAPSLSGPRLGAVSVTTKDGVRLLNIDPAFESPFLSL